ncbi:Conserved_hypothetical protein [Hexamita inflata]|uniref:Uncharacterized protein n=1 Tax=Hexamita inflata TaxID=28002 RepID=A0AA86RGW7_9EUKA|nr:Conserved hypothetical protein [Hexamita inflata]
MKDRQAVHTQKAINNFCGQLNMSTQTTVDTASDKTSITAVQSITANYNTIKSSIIQFEESSQLTKFNTYSQIIIKRYMLDEINISIIKDMVTQLVALAELCFTDSKSGSQKKFNVKSQIQSTLQNQRVTANEKIADAYLDLLVEDAVNDNTKKQLIALAKNILKIANEATGCLSGFKGCM